MAGEFCCLSLHRSLFVSPSPTLDPEQLKGVRILWDRYRGASLTAISHDFYPNGRHEMLHELNRREACTNLLAWIPGILGVLAQRQMENWLLTVG